MDDPSTEVTNPSLYSFSFGAMNTQVSCTFLCENEEHAADLERLTQQWFGHIENRFSRFLPESELSHLNLLAGERCMVSATMLELLTLADAYRQLTDGIFNPFILDILLKCGYNESFERIIRNQANDDRMNPDEPARDEPASMHAHPSDQVILIDAEMKAVRLPPGSKIDLGGLVKGWAVGRLAAFFRNKYSVRQGLINAGGDIALWGTQAEPWRIAIDYPWASSESAGCLLLREGAVASSGTLGRRWQSNKQAMHHLINPFTMRPSSSNVLQCTVIGDDTAACDVWAKTICILGSAEGLDLFSRKTKNCEALLVMTDGTTMLYSDQQQSSKERWRDVHIDRIYETN